MTAAAPLNPTVGDVIKHHANLTSFAASLESANLSSFLGEPTAFGVFGYSVLAPSDAAFSALPEAMKGMFDVGSLRYEILSHHINLRTTTPNAVCAGAAAPLPGYNVTTMASQTLSILCYTCPATGSTGDACPTVLAKHTLGNATFTITATPLVASNGVVIVIDGILLPAWLPPAQAPIRPALPADNEPLVFRAINHARRDCGQVSDVHFSTLLYTCLHLSTLTLRVAQVDAASSVPPAIYKDEGNLKRYIDLTLEHFQMSSGLKLELGTCAEAGYTTVDAQRPPETIAWDTGDLFSYYCASDLSNEEDGEGCGCVIGFAAAGQADLCHL